MIQVDFDRVTQVHTAPEDSTTGVPRMCGLQLGEIAARLCRQPDFGYADRGADRFHLDIDYSESCACLIEETFGRRKWLGIRQKSRAESFRDRAPFASFFKIANRHDESLGEGIIASP
jgi:hypothetical protein